MSMPTNPTVSPMVNEDADERRDEDRAEEARADEPRVSEAPVDEAPVSESRADDVTDADETRTAEVTDADKVRTDDTAAADVVHSGSQDRTVPVDTEGAEMMPGDAPPGPAPRLWTGDDARGLRDRLQEAQMRFLDDPRAAVEAADALVAEAIDSFTARLAEQRTAVSSWRDNGADDTEQLRVVLQRYRDFLERVLAL